MSHMYFILSVAGWIWFALVGVYLVYRLTAKAKQQGRFEVVQRPVHSPADSGGDGK